MRILYGPSPVGSRAPEETRRRILKLCPASLPRQMSAEGKRGGLLPPAQSVPVGGYSSRRVETAEIAQPQKRH